MDQREAITLQGSASYYLHQGNAESVMGLQGSPGMNSMSNPGLHYQTNTGRNMIGSSLPLDTSSTMSPHGMSVGPPPALGVGPPPAMMQGEPVRRKRGRPRKYGRDSAVSLALSPSTSNPVPFVRPAQKRRGRPPGTGRKHQEIPLGGSIFTGPGKLVPHIINVAVGEDIKRKVLSFAQGRQSTVILSGNGTISAVNIRISSSGGSVTYEGRFDILSLTGSYAQNDVNAPHGPVGCLNVTLSGPDGRVIGGGVDGVMLAGSPVQVVVASLLPRTSKTKNIAGGTSADSEDHTVGNLVIPANA
ncbi:AT-hook motif nuclear-localized protein 9-like [Salvia miltiorrhiza]|uniref:AT-hook motif nuclear-localized protein 9-like n=1 Tax=Salvia miltiorrhiza TaxID=226208 RepID=UPI0025ABFBC7|nr:AT-hook motif nuclear-localized protein 9-like [Salvia miltiorrhiza]